LGDTQKALEHFTEALLIYRATRDRYGEADTLSNMGVVYNRMGELQKALDNYKESVSLRLAMGDRLGAAVAFTNIGSAYDSLGDLERALENYNEALNIQRASGNRYAEASTLQNIGKTYRSMGELQKSLGYFDQALTIRRAVGDRSGEALTLINIGKVYQSMGEIPRALEYFNAALLISQNINYRRAEADALQNIGIANNSVGETRKALESLNGALQIRRAVGDNIGEADTLLGIARVEQKSGNLIQARRTIEQAIDIVESVRTQIDSQRLRTSYFATQQEFYQAEIDILMQMHQQNPLAAYDAVALSASERARARSLLELLNEARIDIRQGVDTSLLARERSLQQRLSAKAADQSKPLGRNHTPEQAEATAREIADITAEYDDVEAQIRASSPRYAALTQPRPLNLKEIQQQVLDPETLLLEYSLGETVSHLFVVSDTSITSYQLPNRADIEAATRLVRELLTAPEPRPEDSWLSIQVRMASARKKYWPEAVALSRMLLGPAASQLGTKRLLIVADGALQYLPFGTLPIPETLEPGDDEVAQQGNSKVGRKISSSSRHPTAHLIATPSGPAYPTPLIVKHEIIHLPSASTLAVLRRELTERRPAPKMVAILADPVFSMYDSRVKPNQHHAEDGTLSELTRSVNDVRGELKRLLMTRDEAQAISSLTPPNERLEALDFRANRALCTSDVLSQYRIVHFATHGLLNSEHPYLSGLVLSLVNEQGQPQDGFLRLPEIFNLRLPAELVVLSACQTGLGKEIKGEGLMGLTRGFMYAGAVRVIASLWQVDDVATAELMKRFYHLMLQEQMRPAAALRAAQIEMSKKPQWQSPYYWGAFVLQGEWK
ncbi:MAG: CHAT domain-containing protein, partial [Blastocatellia bacterium]|nr:CHAT domain-containing protein [Blastocatellia bacterium]